MKPFKITFVCTGNTCRSPMAEIIARKWLIDNDITNVVVESAGILASQGQPASQGARWAASEGGADLDRHGATLLTRDLVAQSDVILAMSESHRLALLDMAAGDKVHRLRDFAREHGDVMDPFGGPDHVYQATFREIEGLVQTALERLRDEGRLGSTAES